MGPMPGVLQGSNEIIYTKHLWQHIGNTPQMLAALTRMRVTLRLALAVSGRKDTLPRGFGSPAVSMALSGSEVQWPLLHSSGQTHQGLSFSG